MDIRRAREADLDAVERLYDEIHAWEEAGGQVIGWQRGVYPTRRTAADALARGDLFVMEDDGIVGAGIINRIQVDVYAGAPWAWDTDRVCVLHTLVISPRAAGHGYGRAFVAYYERWAAEHGLPELRIDTNARNAAARAMYRRLGYSEVATVPTTFNGISGVDLVLLEKRLEAPARSGAIRPGTRKADMPYRLIAMDLDGTLNNDQKTIDEPTRDALMSAQARGVRLLLASARPLPGLYRERDALALSDHSGLLMAYNGGLIVDAGTGETLSSTAMAREQTRAVLRALEALPVTPILDDGRVFYVTDKTGYKVEYECWNNRMDCVEVPNLADFLSFAPCKLLMSVEPALIRDVQGRIAAGLPEGLTVVQTAPFYLEVIPSAVNKGEGLRAACRAMGIDCAEAIAFGDSENDIEMLKAAGVGVAMGNAAEDVKRAADMVTSSNNDNGIAKALEALLR